VRTAGGVALPPSLAPDGLQPLRAATESALDADVLVFSGGVSVGKYDYVKEVLDAMGMETFFWRVRQRPGKPLVFGMLRGKPVFGLPGNPTASAICFEQYVRPALAVILGRKEILRPLYFAELNAPVQKKLGLHYFSRGRVSSDDAGCLRVDIAGPQASGRYVAMTQANCIFHMPEPMENPPAGTRVQFEWLTWGS
jgi:molybdopterin molybdotransferase